MTVTNAPFGFDHLAMADDSGAKPVRPLSRREREVVERLDKGLTPKEIAFELGIAPPTVRVFISRAAKKGRRPRRS
jgi:DNA-binding NarL/FixJ family response regulator